MFIRDLSRYQESRKMSVRKNKDPTSIQHHPTNINICSKICLIYWDSLRFQDYQKLFKIINLPPCYFPFCSKRPRLKIDLDPQKTIFMIMPPRVFLNSQNGGIPKSKLSKNTTFRNVVLAIFSHVLK